MAADPCGSVKCKKVIYLTVLQFKLELQPYLFEKVPYYEYATSQKQKPFLYCFLLLFTGSGGRQPAALRVESYGQTKTTNTAVSLITVTQNKENPLRLNADG